MNAIHENVVFNYGAEDSYRFYGVASRVGPFTW